MTAPKVSEVTVLAPAKVNLFLHIIGRRDDGLHLLESLFAFADFGDRITVKDAEKFSFKVTGPLAKVCKKAGCDGKTNLVFEAARKLKPFSRGKAAEITLEKNLPLSAGLGGGSSDAAATLKALQVLWGIEVDEKDLFKIALELGSDVPACLLGKPCFVTGVGESISPLDKFEPLFAVLVNPRRPLSTPLIFKTFKETKRPFTTPLAVSGDFKFELRELLLGSHNDLQGPAISHCREVSKILGALQASEGAYVSRISGSGATCFGLFHKKEESEKAAAWLTREHPKWWIQACRLVADPPFLLSRD